MIRSFMNRQTASFTGFVFPQVFALLVLCLLAAFAASAQASPHPLNVLVKEWGQAVDRAEKSLQKPDLTDEALETLQTELTSLRLSAVTASNAAMPEVQQISEQLKALGELPAEGAPPEPPDLSKKRKVIREELAAVEAAIKEADLIVARANHLLEQGNALRRARFTDRILLRWESPLAPEVWSKALPEIGSDLASAGENIKAWSSTENFAALIGQRLVLALLASVILIWPLRLWLLRRFGQAPAEAELSHGRRLRIALQIGLIRILLPSSATIAVYLAIDNSGLLPVAARQLAWILMASLIFLFFVAAFCRAALAPFEPALRIVRINDYGARAVSAIVTGLAAVFAADQVLQELQNQFKASLELTILHNFVASLLISALLLMLLRRSIWQAAAGPDADGTRPGTAWRRLRWLLRLLVCAIPVSALLGYVALSRMLATELVFTAGLYVAVVLLRKIAAETIRHALSRQTPLGAKLWENLSLSEDGFEMLCFWLTEIVGAIIVLFGLLALLVLWGAGREDLSNWLFTAFFGFKVGNITVSPADVLLALLLFAALLAATRLFQHSLEHRVFPRTRMDMGVRHSIRSAVGYLGFTVAAAVAVSTVGINLSNLAMIAGALSVGIGFGLQNIVNNFVSGLILLIERPIKVGDWVVVGDHQGYVKKISVRATEISTFDRASVFIPNSSLISSPVMNRTYADKVGRLVLPITLAAGEDARRVKELLLEIMKAHAEIRISPPPSVFFKGFGDNGLHFELFAFIDDVDKLLTVTSDLCFQIQESFRREGIQMPYPHREVHLGLREEQVQRLLEAMSRPAQDRSGNAVVSGRPG